jgi:hypothetical protein
MFGRKSDPARVYRFGGHPPTQNAERVDQQMRQAHRYKNAIVHRERIRRGRVDRLLVSMSPRLAEVEAVLPRLEQASDAAYDAIRAAHIHARERVQPPKLVAAYKEAKRALAEARAERKALRTILFATPEWKEKSAWIEERDKHYIRRLRSVCGLYWGTYLHVEQSMDDCRKGAPPNFHRWDGHGHLAVQIQKGISVQDAFGDDPRIRIEPVPPEAWLPGGRRLRRTRVHFRVGSDPSGHPVFAVFPIVLHRPMPKDAQIKWVHAVRHRIATHCEWSVQFVLTRTAGWKKSGLAQSGRVGIDVGWRKRPGGSLRAAYWFDDQGREGEVLLPPDWVGQMQRVRDIQSIRDKLRNKIVPVLEAGLRAIPGTPPPKIAQILPYLSQIRSQQRLSHFIDDWRMTFRFEGDAEIFGKAEIWRKRDKHLYEFEGNLRDQLQRRRLDLYRVFAAWLRRTYKTVAVECLDLRDFHKLPDADEPMTPDAVKAYVRDACLSSFFGALKESGAKLDVLPAPYTTLIHSSCGTVQEFDRTRLHNTCSHCGERYDQDRNAAINLLNGSSDQASEAA